MKRLSLHLLICVSLATCSFAQTIRTSRPRLLLNTTRKGALQAKINGTPAQKDQWTVLKTYTDEYFNGTNLGVAFNAALIYQMDPALSYSGKNYGVRACEIASYHIDDTDGDTGGLIDSPEEWQGLNQNRWNTPVIVFVYDWAYNACTPAQRAKMESFFQNVYNYHSTHYYGFFDGKYYATANNLFAGQVRTNAMAAIALFDPANFPQAAGWMTDVVTVWRTGFVPCSNSSGAGQPYEVCWGGSWPEGVEYAPETKAIYWDFLDYVRTGTTDADLFSEVPEFAAHALYYHIHNASPTGRLSGPNRLYEPYPYRDVQIVGNFWVVDRILVVRLSDHFRRLNDATKAGHAQWWLNDIQPKYKMRDDNNSGYEADEFLFYEPGQTAINYTTDAAFPRSWITPFMLLSRDSWNSDATWVGFHGMQVEGDHMHGDPGQLQVYRKGKWLTREIPGYGGDYAAGHYHNVPILNWHAPRSFGYAAGWARMARTTNGYRAECDSGTYCHAQVDGSDAYRATGWATTPYVESGGVLRDMLYLNPDLVVIADRWKYVPGLNAMSISLFQAFEAAAVAGKRVTLSNLDQRLHINVVAPANPIIKSYLLGKMRIMGARKLNNDSVDIYTDGLHHLTQGQQVTLSGATGSWSAINGIWNVTLPNGASQSTPYEDGTPYNTERFRISSTGVFAGIDSAWGMTQDASTDRTRTITIEGMPFTAYRVEIGSGQYLNEESHLLVLEAADNSVTPVAVTNHTSATVNVAQFGNHVVSAPKGKQIPGTINYPYTVTGSPVRHFIMGLQPTAYYAVDKSVAGQVTISLTGGPGPTTVRSTASGLLKFETEGAPALLEIVTESLPDGLVGAAYSQTLQAQGGTWPYSWSVTAGSLPNGLTLSPGGVISGTPTTEGSATFTAQVTDSAAPPATAQRELALTATATTPAVLNISVAGKTSTRAILLYGRDGLPANRTCQVTLATDSSFQNVVESIADTGGAAFRERLFGEQQPLAPASIYHIRAVCGGETAVSSFSTNAGGPPSPRTLRLSLKGPEGAAVASVRVEYGATAAMGNQVSSACSNGCLVQIDANSDTVVFLKHLFLDALNQPVAVGRQSMVAMP